MKAEDMRKAIFLFVLVSLALWKPRCAAQEGVRRDVRIRFYDSPWMITYNVLGKPRVRRELRLTSAQLAELKALDNLDTKDVPGLTNLVAQAKTADPATRPAIRAEEQKLWDAFCLGSVSNILTGAQRKRLQQIIWQVDGIRSMDRDPRVAAALALTDEQLEDVKEVNALFDPIVDPLRHRLGRQMIAGVGGDETMRGREEQVVALAKALIILEKERDRDLYGILSPNQRELWRRLLGKAIRLQWPLDVF
jgi:hypothetical protein